MSTVVRELINLIGWKVDEKQLSAAEKKAKKFQDRLKKFGAAVGVSIIAIGAAAINAAADMESLTAQFEVMLGSADAAQQHMKDLTDFAAKTPFQLKGLAEASQMLIQYGVAQEDILPSLRMLGDVAGNSSDRFNRLALAFAQVKGLGRANMMDIRQMINAGFNPLAAIAEKTGEEIGEVEKRVSAGAVSFQEISDAFKTATSEGGRFYQNMEKQSQTFTGMLSTTRDNITLLLAEIGKKLLPVLKNVLQRVTELMQGSLGQIISDLLRVITPILNIALKLSETLLKGLMPIIKTLSNLLIPLFEILTAVLEPVTAILDILLNEFGDIIADIGDMLIPLLQEVANLLIELMPLLLPIVKIFVRIFALFLKLKILSNTLFIRIMIKALTLILKMLQPIIKLISLVLVPAFEKLEEIMEKVSEFMENIAKKIADSIINIVTSVLSMINDLIQELNKLPFMKEKQIDPFDIEALQNKMIKKEENNNQQNNVNMRNYNTFNGVDSDKKGEIKRQLQQAVASPFQLQILRVIQEL